MAGLFLFLLKGNNAQRLTAWRYYLDAHPKSYLKRVINVFEIVKV